MKRFVCILACMLSGPFGLTPGQIEPALAQTLADQQTIPDFAGHFQVFRADGTPASLDDIVASMAEVDAVLIGEIHTDPVGHWIESELFRRALEVTGAGDEAGARRSVALSLEMFERDVQHILDEYLQDLITESHFKSSARPWEHYDEDYRALVEMAKEAGVPVLAANAPRRYVNRVSRFGPSGLDDLPLRARNSLPPLPYPAPSQAYRDEWNALMSGMTMESQCPAPEPTEEEIHEDLPPAGMPPGPPAGMPSHGSSFMENGLWAQTLWDASMAQIITSFLDMNPGSLVVHLVGGFHVQNHTGTPEKIQFYRPGTRSLVVHMDLAKDFRTFDPSEHAGRGDFVILTDEALDLNIQRNCGEQ
jgi:uncharacterized iron-regulated protein